ncbi:MAG TPA: hypothetical protein VIA62_26910 [Thermoanaerobaculia bacterium]|nr:hypothetical protein [Thermoanaerobaculia bacterium]
MGNTDRPDALAGTGIPALAFAQTGTGGGTGNGGNNGGFSSTVLSNPQPVLIYTVFGSTLAGDNIISSLVVYNNGLSVWSGNGNSGLGTGTSNIQFSQGTSDQVFALIRDLRRAGAFRQGGRAGAQPSPDTPMTTITVFINPDSNSGTSVARTFSFFSADTGRGRVNDVITSFLNNNFNGSGGTGGGGTGQ